MNLKVVRYAFLIVLAGCSRGSEFNSPEGYDLAAPEKILMKENLLEISGIAFNLHRPDTVFSVNDEEGRLYTMSLDGKGLRHTRFARNGDYEDVAILRERAYVLRSDGTIFTFSLDSTVAHETVTSASYHLLPKGEYEGLYGDETQQKLFVLCKQCGKKKDILQGQSLHIYPDSLVLAEPFLTPLPGNQEKEKKGLLPSALAQNPVTREWFVISSVNKILWAFDSQWNIKGSYTLNPKIFIQPEGMAFDDQQNLYISNEGNEIHNGNILRFSFHPN